MAVASPDAQHEIDFVFREREGCNLMENAFHLLRLGGGLPLLVKGTEAARVNQLPGNGIKNLVPEVAVTERINQVDQ